MSEEKDFCGLWRQCGGNEECLINVVECKLGAALDSTNVDRLWVRAEMTKYKEGAMIGEAFEIVMPKKGYIFRPDTVYPVCEKGVYPRMFELSGAIYGPSPLYRSVPDTVHLTDSSVYTDREKEAFGIPAGVRAFGAWVDPNNNKVMGDRIEEQVRAKELADLTTVWDLKKAGRMQKAINLGMVRPGEVRDMLGMANGVVKEDEKGV